jgi:hypothetical protein
MTLQHALIILISKNPPLSIEQAREVITTMESAYGRPCVFPFDMDPAIADRLELFRFQVDRSDRIDSERIALGYTESTYAKLLDRLRNLDANGYASITDGSIDSYGIEERCEMVKDAIRHIESQDKVYVVFPDDIRLARSRKYPVLIKKGTRVYYDGCDYVVYGRSENFVIPPDCVAIQSPAM